MEDYQFLTEYSLEQGLQSLENTDVISDRLGDIYLDTLFEAFMRHESIEYFLGSERDEAMSVWRWGASVQILLGTEYEPQNWILLFEDEFNEVLVNNWDFEAGYWENSNWGSCSGSMNAQCNADKTGYTNEKLTRKFLDITQTQIIFWHKRYSTAARLFYVGHEAYGEMSVFPSAGAIACRLFKAIFYYDFLSAHLKGKIYRQVNSDWVLEGEYDFGVGNGTEHGSIYFRAPQNQGTIFKLDNARVYVLG